MEKLNNENNVSRETLKKEVEIVFKTQCGDTISIHRIEMNDINNCLDKAISYITDLLKTYKVDGYAIIYVDGRWAMMVDVREYETL